jgi:hypothetical protein
MFTVFIIWDNMGIYRKGFIKMYSYKISFQNGRITTNLNNYTSLKALKESYLRYVKGFCRDRVIDEIIVFKHSKIHSFRNIDFDIDKTKSANLHNIIFNL